MADAIIDLQATNLFNINSNFKTTSSGTTTESTNPTVQDEYGNVSCESVITDITTYTQELSYCGSDFMTDFTSDETPILEQFGNVFNSKVITGITISATAAEYCTISIEGHNHDVNAHAAGTTIGYADMSDFMPHELLESFASWTGFGVPDFGVTTGDDASPSSATITFSVTHADETNANGDHLVGKNIAPRAELSMDFSGVPTSSTLALLNTDFANNSQSMLGAVADTVDSNDSNSDFDSFALTAHANGTLTT